MKFLLLILGVPLAMLLGCNSAKENKKAQEASTSIETNSGLTIAFGSCNRQDLLQPLWPAILEENPQLWIWLGDNIYGDTYDMEVMAQKYIRQKQQPDYHQLREATEIIGTWDDHDYGVNDGGASYSQKEQSQQLMLDFMDVAPGSARRRQEGVYSAHSYNHKDLHLKVLLLDTRYFRDPLQRDQGRYIPSPTGTMLGQPQWAWLEIQLQDALTDLFIIGSSIQVLSNQHPYEKWANFPQERQKLLELISQTTASGVIFLSGDRHIAEISRLQNPELPYQVYDVTSSGLTHSWEAFPGELNPYRVGEVVTTLNYGLLHISATDQRILVQVSIKGEGQTIKLQERIQFDRKQ
ncbi:MAG: alkaline phosphatase D family protein [Candidatus Cyclobacteriaceae bacterium M3_2C_046]